MSSSSEDEYEYKGVVANNSALCPECKKGKTEMRKLPCNRRVPVYNNMIVCNLRNTEVVLYERCEEIIYKSCCDRCNFVEQRECKNHSKEFKDG